MGRLTSQEWPIRYAKRRSRLRWMTSSLVKAAPPSEGLKHPQNGAAVCYLEDPPGVGSTRGEGKLARCMRAVMGQVRGSPFGEG
jgi:hypothetical protein